MADTKTLAGDICTSLKSITNAFSRLGLGYAKDCVINLLRVIVEASKYVNDFFKKGKASKISNAKHAYENRLYCTVTERLVAASFRHELDEYRTTLQARRLDFREVVFVQTLINTDRLCTLRTVVLSSLADSTMEK